VGPWCCCRSRQGSAVLKWGSGGELEGQEVHSIDYGL